MAAHPTTSDALKYLTAAVESDPGAFVDEKWQAELFRQVFDQLTQFGLFDMDAGHREGIQCVLLQKRGYSALKSSRQLACLITTGESPNRTREIAIWSVGSPLHPALAAKEINDRKAKKKRSSGATRRNPPGYLSVPWATEHAAPTALAADLEGVRHLATDTLPASMGFRTRLEAWGGVPQESRATVAEALRAWYWAALECERMIAISPTGRIGFDDTHGLSRMGIRLKRTLSAYRAANGDIQVALRYLRKEGHPISQSTFYSHLTKLDALDRNWRKPSSFPAESDSSEFDCTDDSAQDSEQ